MGTKTIHQWAQGVAIVMGPKELDGFHGESCEQWAKKRGTPSWLRKASWFRMVSRNPKLLMLAFHLWRWTAGSKPDFFSWNPHVALQYNLRPIFVGDFPRKPNCQFPHKSYVHGFTWFYHFLLVYRGTSSPISDDLSIHSLATSKFSFF
jgi:hypothetical protein